MYPYNCIFMDATGVCIRYGKHTRATVGTKKRAPIQECVFIEEQPCSVYLIRLANSFTVNNTGYVLFLLRSNSLWAAGSARRMYGHDNNEQWRAIVQSSSLHISSCSRIILML